MSYTLAKELDSDVTSPSRNSSSASDDFGDMISPKLPPELDGKEHALSPLASEASVACGSTN